MKKFKTDEEIERIAEDLIPANMNNKFMILKRDAFCYHLSCEKRAIDPRNPTFPIIKKRILVLEPANYNKYFGPRVSIEQQIENKKTMGIHNVELIHDPTLLSKEQLEEIVLIRNSVPVDPSIIRKQMARPATIGDLEKLKK
jgi:hypothetical protein